jgi:hypothetical protein
MGAMKRLAEDVSVEMGLQGEITPEVLVVGEYALDYMQCMDTTWASALKAAIQEWKRPSSILGACTIVYI